MLVQRGPAPADSWLGKFQGPLKCLSASYYLQDISIVSRVMTLIQKNLTVYLKIQAKDSPIIHCPVVYPSPLATLNFLQLKSVSPKYRSARGHSNKTKQDFGLTDFSKGIQNASLVSVGTNHGEAPATLLISACLIDGRGCKKYMYVIT